jgi:hypothetical protein
VWQEHFQQVYVGYYDALQEDPYGFYQDICAFLQIEIANPPPQELNQVINSGKPATLPEELRQYLNQQYLIEVRKLAKWSDSPYPKMWLMEMEKSP